MCWNVFTLLLFQFRHVLFCGMLLCFVLCCYVAVFWVLFCLMLWLFYLRCFVFLIYCFVCCVFLCCLFLFCVVLSGFILLCNQIKSYIYIYTTSLNCICIWYINCTFMASLMPPTPIYPPSVYTYNFLVFVLCCVVWIYFAV